jgi:hypothetical protein
MAISVEKLQSLLKETVPGWDTQRIGDLDDPENLRTPATVLDSLLHAHGKPTELNIMSEEELAPLMYPFDSPRAFYDIPKRTWTINPYDAEYKSDVWWKSTFNPIGYLAQEIRGVGGEEGIINASTLHSLIEELAHDIQFKDPQYKASKTGHADYVDAGDPVYLHIPYEAPGALEHEAHSVIAPSLWNLLRKIKTSDKELIGYGDFGSNKYPHTSLSDYGEGKYTWPIEKYKYKPLIEDDPTTIIQFSTPRKTYYKEEGYTREEVEAIMKKDKQLHRKVKPTSSVHDVGKLY